MMVQTTTSLSPIEAHEAWFLAKVLAVLEDDAMTTEAEPSDAVEAAAS